jgi:hypothetical protein
MHYHTLPSIRFQHFLKAFECDKVLEEHLRQDFHKWIFRELEFSIMKEISSFKNREYELARYGADLRRNWVLKSYLRVCRSSLYKPAFDFMNNTLPENISALVENDRQLTLARSDYLQKLTRSVVRKHLTQITKTHIQLCNLRNYDEDEFSMKLDRITTRRMKPDSTDFPTDEIGDTPESVERNRDSNYNNRKHLTTITETSNVVAFPQHSPGI